MSPDDPDPTSLADGTVLLPLVFGFGLLSVGLAIVRFGLDATSRTRLLQTINDDARIARITRYLNQIDNLRVAIMLLAASVEAGFVLSLVVSFAVIFSLAPISPIPIALAVTTFSIFLIGFARIIPRVIVSKEPEKWTVRLLPWVYALSIGLRPIVATLVGFQRLISRGTKASLDESFNEEIRARVAEGEREGIVAEDTAEMIENVVEFRDVEVSEVMTPRTDVDWVNADESVMSALRIASEKGHSRLPVGEEDSDHIIGVFYVRDVLSQLDNFGDLKDMKTRDLCRKPFFVPEPKSVKALLQEFRESKVHIAIVLDEYGGTSGIITIEDILEEIVGDIDDEYDEDDRSPSLTLFGADEAEVDARTHICDVNDALDIELPESDDFDTVGGFVFATLGRIPSIGETMSLEGLSIKVTEADDRRVKRLHVTVTNRSTANGNGAAT